MKINEVNMEKPTNTFEALAPRKRSAFGLIIIILIILAVMIVGWWRLSGKSGKLLTGVSSDYQAVFLTNNQVYFGKLTKRHNAYAILTDIFYLQVSQPLQPSEPANNVNLIKLGAELHGPTDSMTINRDHILFVEDLREDSQVVTAIKQYKAQQSQSQ